MEIITGIIFFGAVAAVVLWRKAETRAVKSETAAEQLRTQLDTEKTARTDAENARDGFQSESANARAETAAANARAGAAEKAQKDLREETENQRREITQKAERIVGLETKLQNAQQSAQDEIARLTEVRKSMGAEFKNVAQSILEEKSKKFGEDSGALLKPLEKSLESFKADVNNFRAADAEGRGKLKAQIENLQNKAEEYGKSADHLAQAIKKDSKTQGGWGEVILENILKNSGLREGEEYEAQKAVRGEDGKRQHPDVVVNLPDGKHLIIDSKMPIRAYCDAAKTENPEEEKAALARHVDAVKKHIADLSGKHYARAKGVNAPDFVFMFIGIEQAFFAALKKSPNLFSDAYDKKIILCAPTTLMATLRTVERIWQLERQNRNAEEIARQAGNLYDSFVLFVQKMKATGEALEKAQETHAHAYKQLSEGRGNLVGRANKLRDLGANAKKPRLPERENLPDETDSPDKK